MLKIRTAQTASAFLILALALAPIIFPAHTNAQLNPVNIAEGFEFNVFADQHNVEEFGRGLVTGAVGMAFDARGRMFVGTTAGKILILLDNDDNGVVDEVKTFITDKEIHPGNPLPSAFLGLEFRDNGDLFITSNSYDGRGSIIRLRDTDGDDVADDIKVILDGLPSGGDHQTDRLKFGPEGLLYFGQGSATDAGEAKPGRPQEGPLNAKMLRVDVDAENPAPEVFAAGLRNPFGMAFHPVNGELFSTDGGSGEICQGNNCPPDNAPPEEVNHVVQNGNYGFPLCEGTPSPERADCAGVTAPITQFPRHLTPTSLAFYTGPQAGEFENQLLLTLYKNLPNAQNLGGDLRRLKLEGDSANGFQVIEDEFIARLNPIDPFDGPVETAINPISGDIYVVRYDPVHHRIDTEHHHIIYRIHRTGSDAMPFIGPLHPASVKSGPGAVAIDLIGRHLKPGAVILADGVQIPTTPGADRFELSGILPAGTTSTERLISIEVKNPDGTHSNQQTLAVTKSGNPPGDSLPHISSFEVFKKTRNRIFNPVTTLKKAHKFRLVVEGTDFDAGAQLLFDGVALEIESATTTELIGKFEKKMLREAGDHTIQVRNADGKSSNTVTLMVIAGQ